MNFAAYGASFVYIDQYGSLLTPLYSYLKPYPLNLRKRFYEKYGGEVKFSLESRSPVLGSLNSGMQLYRIKYEHPDIFNKIKYALHLPQYLSYLLSGKPVSDLTSIGSHTNLWDFQRFNYHEWVEKENILEKLAPIVPSDQVTQVLYNRKEFFLGVGLHDSSAALIPYFSNYSEPFILISTGTWCISFNPFNHIPLTSEELKHDCLCYISYYGQPVKASRVFAGNQYEKQTRRIAEYFNQQIKKYKNLTPNYRMIDKLKSKFCFDFDEGLKKCKSKECLFSERDLGHFDNDEEAYHSLMLDIMCHQYISTNLVIGETKVKSIFVDGGFSKNAIYMNLLASVFPGIQIFGANIPQATALGSALAIHSSWNSKPYPHELIQLKNYSFSRNIKL